MSAGGGHHAIPMSYAADGATRCIPSEMFANRKQVAGSMIALISLTLLWLLSWWVSLGHDVRVFDCDDSNCFCNIPREDIKAAVGSFCGDLGQWAERFYAALRVRVVTSRGLTQEYPLLHGCGQGDSGGVGVYTALGVLRTTFHRVVLAGGLAARNLISGAQQLPDVGLPLPDGGILTEVCFSDDRRLLSGSNEGMARLLSVVSHGCWAAGGSVNFDKFSLYRVQLRDGRMVYCRQGHVNTEVGDLQLRPSGLKLVGIPLVMGESSAVFVEKVTRRLRLIRTGVRRLRPT